MPWGSNYTFLLWLTASADESSCIRAIYKPKDGEKPLYDFPQGTLYKREYAAYLLSLELGWPNIPATVIREGPYGIGTMQLYIDCDPRITYFDMREYLKDKLSKLAVFDLLTNNADRKASHCILDKTETIWSIDHGLTFHTDFKLRSVMLEYCGDVIEDDLLCDLRNLKRKLKSKRVIKTFSPFISGKEIAALISRLDCMINDPKLPMLDPYKNVPWPLA